MQFDLESFEYNYYLKQKFLLKIQVLYDQQILHKQLGMSQILEDLHHLHLWNHLHQREPTLYRHRRVIICPQQ